MVYLTYDATATVAEGGNFYNYLTMPLTCQAMRLHDLCAGTALDRPPPAILPALWAMAANLWNAEQGR